MESLAVLPAKTNKNVKYGDAAVLPRYFIISSGSKVSTHTKSLTIRY